MARADAVGFGFLTWIGFGYVAMRTKRPRWFAWSGFYLVVGSCIGGFAHALAIAAKLSISFAAPVRRADSRPLICLPR